MYKSTMKKMSDAELKSAKSSLSWGLISGESKNTMADEAAINRIDRELRSRAVRAEQKRIMNSACIGYDVIVN